MENNSKINNIIKISILDIFPSFSELNPKQEEMFAIFQGLNNFFDLEELLSTHKKIEIENSNQSSLIVSLIKSNNIIASGFINIKQGEQWITLNYETKNKKISSKLAFNLMDCIKIKIFCEAKNKNQINNTLNNVNFNNSSLNINTNINYTNRNNNKTKNVINQINLKITKKNNNKILLKNSPIKGSYNKYTNKRSPIKNIHDFNSIKLSSNEDLINNNNLIKNNNFNTYNYMNVNINMNPYTTISKCSIKKIDLNTSNKTRNLKIAHKKSINGDYTTLRTSNNNYCIKKMNTSTCSLNTINKNKNKKWRLTPDLEIKGIKNEKIGGSPGPNFKHKKKLDDNAYDKNENIEKSNDKTFHYESKLTNFKIKETNKNNNNEENNIFLLNKAKNKQNYLSNNINNENNNLNLYHNETNRINYDDKNQINNNNYSNTFNNTFNNINKKVIKNKLLYTYKNNNNSKINNNNKNGKNKNDNNNINYSNSSKKNNDIEGSINSFEEEQNKTKENIKISNKEKVGIYTTKRINIKKNKNIKIKCGNKDSKNSNSQKNIIRIDNNELIQSNDINVNIKKKEESKNISDNKENKIDKNKNNIEHDKEKKSENIEDEEDFEDNDFIRMKEDFILLYNDDYAKNIQDDLFNLEIELFIEKMAELIACYHIQLEQKKIENELIQNDYNTNVSNYKNINKLIKKLELCELDFEIKNIKSKNYRKSLKKQDTINLVVNKTEIEIFKNIFPDNFYNNEKEKKNKLKAIILNIIKKEENRNILSNNELFNEWVNIYNKKNEKGKNEIKKNNSNQFEQKININNNKKNIGSISSLNINDNNTNFTKNNNSYFYSENTYRKKMPISPIFKK